MLRTVLRATARCLGFCHLATCFGAWIVMPGSAVHFEGVSVWSSLCRLVHIAGAIDNMPSWKWN